MTAVVTLGDAKHLHLPDQSVDLVVTSPPYFGLRSYQDGGEHYAGQVGAEATPAEYLDALIACTAEWVRVLKPGGSIFVNLGDSYYSGKGAPGRTTVDAKSEARTARRAGGNPLDGPSFGIGRKSLVGLPWRYAIRCIDELGLILRAEIVWAKPNGLPESVTDRVRRSHEQVFHFVKQPRYYSAVDEVREEAATIVTSSGAVRYRKPGEVQTPQARSYTAASKVNSDRGDAGMVGKSGNPLGKLPGSVWEIPTAPLKVPASLGIDHFAAYPPELVRRIVLGWSPREVCTACGEGRRPVVVKEGGRPVARAHRRLPGYSDPAGEGMRDMSYVVTSYACACPNTDEPATPGVVLDPFGGTGTTALVASCYGRVGISVDLSADYCRLAQWRTTDEKQRAKAARSPKTKRPRVPAPKQAPLFGEEAS